MGVLSSYGFNFGHGLIGGSESVRFGYDGFLPAINEASGVLFIGLAYYVREVLLYREREHLMLALVVVSCILSGAKAAIVGTIGLLAVSLFILDRKKFFLLMIPGLVVGAFVLFKYYLPFLMYGMFGWITSYYFSHDISLFNLITSGRFENAARVMGYYFAHWTPFNYIFGGINLSNANGPGFTEMDLSDGYIMMGMTFIVYLFSYTRLFFKYDKSAYNVLVFVSVMILATLGGHFLISAIMPQYLLMYLFTSRENKAQIA